MLKKHLVLVHGFCHGAWCWYKVIPLLEKSGHKVTALDLGASGVNMKQQLNEIGSVSDYVQPLMDFMISDLTNHDEKVILVGHSYGGLCISLAMEAFPHKISAAVFISAYMPNHIDPPALLIQEFFRRTSMELLMDCRLTFDQGIENPPTSAIFGPQYMQAILYKHCQPEGIHHKGHNIPPNLAFTRSSEADEEIVGGLGGMNDEHMEEGVARRFDITNVEYGKIVGRLFGKDIRKDTQGISLDKVEG
ncbi:hypothetical protein HAX54_009150 [Datura stramonium]|uniref:AB hydrolase-1 domain-containing protein n=1 Tax=Datura stramonium TaxID=4076 RepID=A0ABS8TED2_DATST|nr:hypothetical protein [Datura stramonium]